MRRLASLTFKQLRALEAVDRTGSISRAAEELGLSAPAVHSQLKALDQTFGCAMLSRDGAGPFHATPEGAALLQAHEKADAGFRMALHRIDALQKGMAGTVVLGVVSTGKYFAPGIVAAQDYPKRPITVIVPFNAGGSTDLLARAYAREMEELTGVSLPVQNIGGGAGTIGAARLARSRPDGYTIGFIPADQHWN